jgi:ketosteroid isomerase-like protein
MPEHPNATVFRAGFQALWERGDVAPFLTLLRDDVEWINDIGAGPWREIHGKEAVLAFYGEWMQLFDENFH